ncbi:hypothetical protein ACFY30_22120 [Streptomyces sp. NPDC000345]|uniref:hypothetical protein n=1 Tax=Streptomyces sp. NPDC000345 TaxID=3364537 RepID=UPI00368F4E80
MSGRCDCRYCASPAAEVAAESQEPIELPAVPTPIRVHKAGLRPQDCTLHPDGTLTAVFNGHVHRNLMSFADMRERNWRHARLEFNPGPLPEEPEPTPAAEAVQQTIPL